MKGSQRWWTRILISALAVSSAAALYAADSLYDDVYYLADLKEPTLHLKVLRRTPVTFSRDPQSVIAYLAAGQTVEVVGLGESQDAVNARTAMGKVQGWVAASALVAPPAGLLETLRKRQDRAERHRVLIEQHQVVVGMTRAEVRASLGKPDRTERVGNGAGHEEQWFYNTYKYTPHYVQNRNEPGRFGQTLSYGRVPTGHKIVTFRQDEVIEITDDEAAATTMGSAAAAQVKP
ncbi:MAG TPA: hypothetical protein VL171_05605 [Verrucomicrobiae bacterium]|nr:hypothetical protein [Verrucomicrobiae bacterium]